MDEMDKFDLFPHKNMGELKQVSIIAFDSNNLPIYGYILDYYGNLDHHKITYISRGLQDYFGAAWVEINTNYVKT